VAPAAQTVGGGRVGVEDHGVQCLIRAAHSGQECGMRAVLAPVAGEPGDDMPGRSQDDGDGQHYGRHRGWHPAGDAARIPGRATARCLPGQRDGRKQRERGERDRCDPRRGQREPQADGDPG
jgi:hypothetical protein